MDWKKRWLIMISVMLLLFCIVACNKQEASSTLPIEQNSQVPNEMVSTTPLPAKTDGVQEKEGFYGKLSVVGAHLVGEEKEIVQLKGVSSHGLSWFPQYANRQMLRQLEEEWGCNVFRLAMYTAEYNGYCTGDTANKEALKALIDEVVTEAEALELYVIIDWHILSDNNPLFYQEEAKAFFGEMAEKYGDKPHVIYEICNEPNGEATWEDIKAYADEVIPIIRQYTDAVIIVGTPTWSQDVDVAGESPLTVYDNIVYALHYYAATHGEALRTRAKAAIQAGLPLFVSEFGICDASGNGAIDEAEADLWLAFLEEYHISYVMWNLSNKDESSAMLLPECTKTAGFTAADLSPAGRWFVSRMTRTAAAPVESSPNETQESKVPTEEELQIAQVGTWQAEGTNAYQYVITLHNTTDMAWNDWEITLQFNQEIVVQDSWNGIFISDGKKLIITPAAYNKTVAAGSMLSDVGVILHGTAGLEIVGTTLQYK